MKAASEKLFNRFLEDNPSLVPIKGDILAAFQRLTDCYAHGGKVLICGNGGSASDAEHIVGELMKGFLLKRPVAAEEAEKFRQLFPDDGDMLASRLQGALPAISLVSQSALMTAYINDVAADMAFAQQVYGYARPGDVVIGLSTSGNSANVVNAIKVAKAMGAVAIGMTGEGGGKMNGLCDALIRVPARETYRIQEYHLPVYHVLCAMVEAEFFDR